MENKKTIWVSVFGITLIIISAYGAIYLLILSNLLELKINIGLLAVCIVPAILGMGIIKLNNFFRILTICVSTGLVIFSPIVFFFTKKSSCGESCSDAPSDFRWLFLVFLGVFTIYYLTRPGVKRQFKQVKIDKPKDIS